MRSGFDVSLESARGIQLTYASSAVAGVSGASEWWLLSDPVISMIGIGIGLTGLIVGIWMQLDARKTRLEQHLMRKDEHKARMEVLRRGVESRHDVCDTETGDLP